MNSATDNYEMDFPARMSDGRQFTDYRQNCITNNELWFCKKKQGRRERKHEVPEDLEGRARFPTDGSQPGVDQAEGAGVDGR